MRRKIYNVIEPAGNGGRLSIAYDFIMMATIIISIIPLAFKTDKDARIVPVDMPLKEKMI